MSNLYYQASILDQYIDASADKWRIARNRLLGISEVPLTPDQERDVEAYYDWHFNWLVKVECEQSWVFAAILFFGGVPEHWKVD